MGGEKQAGSLWGCISMGSPPRGRGKGGHVTAPNLIERITPAWAGKSGIAEDEHPQAEDHPRVGGEKFTGSQEELSELGSPPRGRGKGARTGSMLLVPRITPAWAGKSHKLHPGRAGTKDHPRVGGEKLGIRAGFAGP